ncbi:MAG: peptidoglycan-binding protein [Paracoccus hibiscisoli]|uniref:peptidoglycan-binding protein n=1 Tax=Paracoccus hibiscisoli TaxID=2023261 RepID=UPI003918A97D
MTAKMTRMRHAAVVVLALTPGMAGAEGAVIRLEAKRSAEAAAQAAQAWADRFDGVVTLPLPGGWTGIAIGPLPADRAGPLLEQLKQAGKVPQDAFVSTPAEGTALTPASALAVPAALPDEAPPSPDRYLRLESAPTEAEGRAALERLRATFPEAGLWALSDGWFAVTLGPVAEEAGRAWLPVLTKAGLIPEDAILARAADLGRPVEEGAAPDLAAPGAPEPLPPLDRVQRALRWAGHYAGAIDGKDGPMTRAAIAAEIATARASTDPGTALRLLEERRAAWADAQGLAPLVDPATGLTVTAPMRALTFDRAERALSIYGPRDGSGAALILFSQPGGQQELLDLAGLVTALGWVPQPERTVRQGHVTLQGRNDAHLGAAEGWVREGRAEGYVLIWPAGDEATHTRLLAEISDSLTRHGPGTNEGAAPSTLP